MSGVTTNGITHRRQTRSMSRKSVLRNEELSQELQQREHEQRLKRGNITLFKHPLQCLSLCGKELASYGESIQNELSKHRWIAYITIFITITLTILYNIEGQHSPLVNQIYIEIEWILWWVILGVLSSVGLGTGMHSGILFLFPYIGEVCLVAATCHTLSFETYGDNSFHCYERRDESHSTVTFMGLYFKIIWACFLWGAGTAIGEIPPYAVSLAAVRAGKQDEFTEELDELNRELSDPGMNDNNNNDNNNNNHSNTFLSRFMKMSSLLFVKMKLWMIGFLEEYGFWAVLGFAAWPNMAFDMCGIACGHFEMPFWKFFGATFIGKALIKVNLQAFFFIFLFNEHMLNWLTDKIEHVGYETIADSFREFMETQRSKFLGDDPKAIPKKTPLIKTLWSGFMIIFMAIFIGSIIQSFAQQYQRRKDDESNEQWMKENNYVRPVRTNTPNKDH